MALHCAHVTTLAAHLGRLIKSAQASWENILNELDRKLATFAANDGAVSLSLEAEFMGMLVSEPPTPPRARTQ